MFVKKKLKRQDFMFQNGWFQTLVRRPGQLHMQQFQISDCQQCFIFLFDAAACVYIDQCKYCTVFVGACQSSVFVRDCTHTKVICTTQQFRVRDCTNCHFAIFCESQPIIESSYDVQISNFPMFGYGQLLGQMQAAKINPWNNNWFDVYDFTPHKFKKVNFELRPLNEANWSQIKQQLIKKIKEIEIKESQCVIPRVIGKGDYEITDFAALAAFPVPSVIAKQQFEILQSKVHNLCQEQLIALGVDIPCQKDKRTKLLFIKVLKKNLTKWKKSLGNVIKQIVDEKTLQLYENTVFAPFKDEH